MAASASSTARGPLPPTCRALTTSMRKPSRAKSTNQRGCQANCGPKRTALRLDTHPRCALEPVPDVALALAGDLGVERDRQGREARGRGSFDEPLGPRPPAEEVELEPLGPTGRRRHVLPWRGPT